MMTESDSTHLSSPSAEMEDRLPALPSLPLPTSDEDLETFLSNVDQVTNLISKLATADSEAELDRLRDDADEFIAKFARATEKSARLKMTDAEGDGVVGGDGGCEFGGGDGGDCPVIRGDKELQNNEHCPSAGESSLVNGDATGTQASRNGAGSDDDNPWRELRHPSKGAGALGVAIDDEEQRRFMKESRANEWREKGNKAFKTGDFELAYYCYSRGLDSKRDCTALWTNRAQALIKMSMYEEALDDCSAAIAVCPDCPKAFVHRGRALVAMEYFDDAETAFKEVLRIDPAKFNKCIGSYLKQVDEARKRRQKRDDEFDEVIERQQEPRRPPAEGAEAEYRNEPEGQAAPEGKDEARLSTERSSQQQEQQSVKIRNRLTQNSSNQRQRYSADVTSTLSMMSVPDQHVDYYVSGLKILAMELVDLTTSTVFRTANGFDLLDDNHHPVINAVLKKPFKDLSPSEVELHDSLFKVLTAVCDRNVENQRKCAAGAVFPEIVLKFLSLPFPHRCKESALRLMHVLVNSELGRDAVVCQFDAALLLSALFSAARDGRRPEGAASAVFATMVFTRLAPDKKYKVNMRDKFAHIVLPAFETLLSSSFSRRDDRDHDGIEDEDDDEDRENRNRLFASGETRSDYSHASIPESSCSDHQLPTPEDVAVVPSSFAVMAVLATDPVLRSLLAGRVDLWAACLDLLDKSIARLVAVASPAKRQQFSKTLSSQQLQQQRDCTAANSMIATSLSDSSFSQNSSQTVTSAEGGDCDDRYVHKMILHMLGFLINISQEDSPHRLRFAPDICAFCVQLLKLQEPKSLWHARSFLNSPPPPPPPPPPTQSQPDLGGSYNGSISSSSSNSVAASSDISATLTSLSKQSSSSAPITDRSTKESVTNEPDGKPASNSVSGSINPMSTPLTIQLPKPATTSPSLIKKDTVSLEEEPHESTRALVLLSLLLPLSDKFVADFVGANGIGPLISFIQYGTKNQVKASVKVTAVCAQQCPAARDDIVSCRKALASIVLLLKHEDEHVIGNAALCLTHCIEVPKVPEKLTKTNVVKHLLVLARDARKIGVQENCAILLAKLAMKENRHLQRLRELHGIEILHTCMKHIKT